jgi:integrase
MRRAKGEGSLLKIYGKKDPVTGKKKAISENWFAQYYDAQGRQRRVSTKTPVRQKALSILRRLMDDTDKGLVSVIDARKVTYGDLRAGLLASYVERGNRSLQTNADGEETITALKALDEFLGYDAKHPGQHPGPSALRITSDTGREFVKKRLADGVGNAWVNRSLACLRRMLRIAYDDGKLQRMPKLHFLKEPPARKGFLEFKKFDELIGLLPTHLRPLATFLYYDGVRLGEALQIDWAQVNLERHVIRLHEEQTKGAEPRVVPLPSPLIAMLRDIEPKTGRVFDDTNLRVEWERACNACGLGTRTLVEPKEGYKWYRYRGLLIHDLRRSAVRNLVEAGVPETRAMKISGHKTRSVFDRYAIASEGDLRKAMQSVELSGVSSESVVKGKVARRRGKLLNR